MFPVDKKGDRFHDPSSPKIAVYSAHPTSKPTVKLAEVKPSPGSAIRSRVKLLQEQKKMATGDWTSSTIHNPSSQAYLQDTLPATGPAPSQNIVPLGTPATQVPSIGQRGARTMEQNLSEQVQVLEGQLAFYKNAVAQSQMQAERGNGAGQYAATALPAHNTALYACQPMAYVTPPHPQTYTQQPQGPQPTAPGVYQATLGYPYGGQHYPVTAEQPNIGASAKFARVGSEPVRVTVKGSPPSNMPAVETHNTVLLEQLQHQQRVADAEYQRVNADLAARDSHRARIEQELLLLRKQSAEAQASAKKARDELDELLARRAKEQVDVKEVETKHHDMKERYDFVCDELEKTRRELERERQIPKYVPTSAIQHGLMASPFDANFGMSDFSGTALASDNESLKVQISEFQQALQQRDMHIDHLNKTNSSLMDENSQLATDLRHEQQKHMLALATTESHKVLLSDAQSEVEYLRLLTGEQKMTIDRMTKDHEERFERIRSEMEARQVRELQAQHATEGAKSLHVEACRVTQALLAEQSVNEALRNEIQSLRQQLEAEQYKNREMFAQYEKLRSDLRSTESTYSGQTANLESLLRQWQQQQARQASEDRGQLQQASDILKTLKALEQPFKNGQLEPPPTSSFSPSVQVAQYPSSPPQVNENFRAVFTDKPSSSISVSGTIQLNTSNPNPSAPQPRLTMPPPLTASTPVQPQSRSSTIQQEVQEILALEQGYRRDAEKCRVDALAALAMHNKALEAA